MESNDQGMKQFSLTSCWVRGGIDKTDAAEVGVKGEDIFQALLLWKILKR